MKRKKDKSLRSVIYFSQQKTNEKKKYHSYEREMLAIVRALKRFRVYLQERTFKVVADCNALRYMC